MEHLSCFIKHVMLYAVRPSVRSPAVPSSLPPVRPTSPFLQSARPWFLPTFRPLALPSFRPWHKRGPKLYSLYGTSSQPGQTDTKDSHEKDSRIESEPVALIGSDDEFCTEALGDCEDSRKPFDIEEDPWRSNDVLKGCDFLETVYPWLFCINQLHTRSVS